MYFFQWFSSWKSTIFWPPLLAFLVELQQNKKHYKTFLLSKAIRKYFKVQTTSETSPRTDDTCIPVTHGRTLWTLLLFVPVRQDSPHSCLRGRRRENLVRMKPFVFRRYIFPVNLTPGVRRCKCQNVFYRFWTGWTNACRLTLNIRPMNTSWFCVIGWCQRKCLSPSHSGKISLNVSFQNIQSHVKINNCCQI